MMKRLLALIYCLGVVVLLGLVASAVCLWLRDWTDQEVSPELLVVSKTTQLLHGQSAREFDGGHYEINALTSTRSSPERRLPLLSTNSSKFTSGRTEEKIGAQTDAKVEDLQGSLLNQASSLHHDPETQAKPRVASLPAPLLNRASPAKQSDNLSGCKLPPGGFRGWSQDRVSQLTPRISANCSKIIAGEKDEVTRVSKAAANWTHAISDQEMLEKLKNCTWLRQEFTNNLYNSRLERNFSMAFTFVVYDSPQQVLRLLRLLYRPQNTYCFHYDRKSKHGSFFEGVAACFDNVLIASKRESVVWGHYTILQAQMNCMSDLLHHRKTHVENRWRYVINLCGKELPLVTNRQMVAKLRKLKGASSVIAESCAKKKALIDRRLRHPVYLNKNKTALILDLGKKLENPPFDMSLYHKSSSYNALSFEFAQHVTSDEKAKKIYNFLKQTKNAEEHFYATLYKTPGVPGGYDKHIPARDYFEIAGSYWTKSNSLNRKPHTCKGKVVHQVCIVAVGDLEEVVKERGNRLFHNKYFMEKDPVVMDCMEERVVRLNRQEYALECPQVTL